MDDSFREFIERTIRIQQLTEAEIVQECLRLLPYVSKTSKLPFIIQGNLQWESQNENGIYSNGIWLKSNLYDPVGKNIFDNPVKNYLQMYLNTYEIGGAIDIDVSQDDLENAKVEIIHALNKITILKNSISLLSESSLDWYPATYIEVEVLDVPSPPKKDKTREMRFLPLQRSQEGHSCIINDDYVKSILYFTKLIGSIKEPIRTVLKTSMDWHADGNRHQSGLGRFVSYWASIELLGNYFYANLDPELIGSMDKSKKKRLILDILSDDLSKDTFRKIEKCYFLMRPPIREKICSFLSFISDSNEWKEALFLPDADSKKSLYQIRNDIAHGSISEHDFEKVASLKKRLADMWNISRKVVLITLGNIEKLVLKS